MRIRHLQSRQQFQHLLGVAPAAKTSHFCLHRLPAGPWLQADFSACALWVGVLVPKRWARRAVTRNLIRRQIYAVALEQCRARLRDCDQPLAVLVRLRGGFHPAPARRTKGGSRQGNAAWRGHEHGREPLRSAASPLLRLAVHQQLQTLFARAFNGVDGSMPPTLSDRR